jgi:hypothetical protein
MMTLDNWTTVVRKVMVAKPYSWIGFIVWIIATTFFILQAFVAVICAALIKENNESKHSDNSDNDEKFNQIVLQMEKISSEQDLLKKDQRDLLKTQVEIQQTLNLIFHHLSNTSVNQTDTATAKPQITSFSVILDEFPGNREDPCWTKSFLSNSNNSVPDSMSSLTEPIPLIRD